MEQVGPYILHEPLGRGGMGAVHRAVDLRSGQEVALKLLAATEEHARRRLVQEARALARLRHRHIVSLLDAGEERGRPWLALELVRGRSLQERLDREGPLAPREAALLVRSLAMGLAHAHREGVLHRDLKPANVLLPDDDDAPKLTDFGLAGLTHGPGDPGQSRLTKSGVFLGSPGYWAPEQASGQARALGPRTDVYGLGALLYACLCGRPPIVGESLAELLVATEEHRPAPTRADRALDAIALRCLEKRPEDRYPAVDAVARELSRYLAGRAPSRRRPVVGGVVAAAALLAVAVVAAVAERSAPAPAPATTAVAPTTPDPPSTPPPPVEDEVEPLLARARERLDAGDAPGALVHLERVLALDPDRALAYAGRSAARLDLGDVRGALEDADRAIALDPAHPTAYPYRAVARDLLGDPEGAARDLEEALRLAPHAPSAEWLRRRLVELRARQPVAEEVAALLASAEARSGRGDHRGALADLDRVVELDPGSARAHAHRGTARGILGDHAGALEDYDRSIELDPTFAGAYVNRGAARGRLGDHHGALADLDRAIALDPTFAAAYGNRGASRERAGDLRGAVADYEEALRLQPDAPWAAPLRQRIAEARAQLGE
ncbi:MAG: tetratricopeptide repeat protein [Planctomycetes bacterium]|nr:tetratricopeptide repeat protein [Planctomycetota bacterium]